MFRRLFHQSAFYLNPGVEDPLGPWVALGTVFFLVKVRSYKAIPEAELRYLIVGSEADSK